MFNKKKNPGFCDVCGSANELVEVYDKNHPYDPKTGELMVFVEPEIGCQNTSCKNNKSDREWYRGDGYGTGGTELVWIGRLALTK
jgi:hypothetical protein